MVIKITKFGKIIFLFLYIVIVYKGGEVLINVGNKFSSIPFDVIYFFLIIMGIYIISVGFTKEISFLPNCMSFYWKIGYKNLIIKEQKDYQIYWNDVDAIYSFFPYWFPIKYIFISGTINGKNVRQIIGSLFSKNYEQALLFVSKKVKKDVFDNNAWKLIESYEKKYGVLHKKS